nr:MAG: hypothetical protein DIU58_11190 [Sphaerobacter thermophilus]
MGVGSGVGVAVGVGGSVGVGDGVAVGSEAAPPHASEIVTSNSVITRGICRQRIPIPFPAAPHPVGSAAHPGVTTLWRGGAG